MSVLFCGYRCVIVCECVRSNMCSVCPCTQTCVLLCTTRGWWVFFLFPVCIRLVEELCEKPSAPFSLDIWSLPGIFFDKVTWTRQSQQRVLHKDAGGTARPCHLQPETEKIEHREQKEGETKERRGVEREEGVDRTAAPGLHSGGGGVGVNGGGGVGSCGCCRVNTINMFYTVATLMVWTLQPDSKPASLHLSADCQRHNHSAAVWIPVWNLSFLTIQTNLKVINI